MDFSLQPLRTLAAVGIALLVLPACDTAEDLGEGNGKVVVYSDLGQSESIEVMLGGEVIGNVTQSFGCESDVQESGAAVAVRPAGTYELSAAGIEGVAFERLTVSITEDEVKRIRLKAPPSAYAIQLPEEIEELPVFVADNLGGTGNTPFDAFHRIITAPGEVRLRITAPVAVQGDRVDVVFNGVMIAEDALLGTEELSYDLDLLPGSNYIAVRLSQDDGGDGTTSSVALFGGGGNGFSNLGGLRATRWNGKNIRFEC